MAIFAPAERLPTSATLAWAKMAILGQNGTLWGVVNLVKMKGYKIRRSVLILGVELKLHTDFANNSRIERKKGPKIASSQKVPRIFSSGNQYLNLYIKTALWINHNILGHFSPKVCSWRLCIGSTPGLHLLFGQKCKVAAWLRPNCEQISVCRM